jgi:phage-related holin
MKTTTLAAVGIYSAGTIMAFICSYFFHLAMTNSDQYLALVGVVMADGFFGVIAGTRREGFQTRKALKVLKTLVVWIGLLTVLLMVEKGFKGTSWLSETILVPFIIFQLLSALKNASMSGFIQMDTMNAILDKIDLHKGDRK